MGMVQSAGETEDAVCPAFGNHLRADQRCADLEALAFEHPLKNGIVAAAKAVAACVAMGIPTAQRTNDLDIRTRV